jgi:DNA-binding response OmpR family regulator
VAVAAVPYKLVIIEDDMKIAEAVREFLSRYGFAVTIITEFAEVEAQVWALDPHLILLDVTLPYLDGFHLCRSIRRRSRVPILFLSARAGEMEQIYGMESGADDYITKPFSLEVLLAKVRAALRRAYGELSPQAALLQVGALQLDLGAAELLHAGQRQALSRTEFLLLQRLMATPGRIVSREACLEAVWDDAAFVDDNTLSVNITRLRSKLAAVGLEGALETKRGMGYLLALPGVLL